MPAIVYAVAALGSLYGWALAASTISYPGSIGLDLDAPGGDWTVFYGAVRAFFSGNLGLIFDGDRFTAYLNSTFFMVAPKADTVPPVGLSPNLSAGAPAF
jgi:hypothetical protein